MTTGPRLSILYVIFSTKLYSECWASPQYMQYYNICCVSLLLLSRCRPLNVWLQWTVFSFDVVRCSSPLFTEKVSAFIGDRTWGEVTNENCLWDTNPTKTFDYFMVTFVLATSKIRTKRLHWAYTVHEIRTPVFRQEFFARRRLTSLTRQGEGVEFLSRLSHSIIRPCDVPGKPKKYFYLILKGSNLGFLFNTTLPLDLGFGT